MAHKSVNPIQTSYFNLRYTFECANPLTFFGDYNINDDSLVYPLDRTVIRVKFTGSSKSGKLFISDGPTYSRKEVIARFRLNDDMKRIYENIMTDGFMKQAVERYEGMRVTYNDPWEATLCFIISQYNNVKRIRKITKNIVDRFGSSITDGNGRIIAKSFPSSSDIAEASVKELLACGAGFRAKYIKEAAEYCANNINLHKLERLNYCTLKDELMGISGVGEKVADCIALMGYGKLEAFPIDVWVKRTMEKIYFKGKSMKIKELHKFATEKFSPYCGYAQEYIFWFGKHFV